MILAKGGGLVALEDGSSDGIRCLSAQLYGTVDEDPTCSSWARTKHIDVRRDLARDTCDAGKVGVVCVRRRTCSKTLDTHKFHKHANTVLDIE